MFTASRVTIGYCPISASRLAPADAGDTAEPSRSAYGRNFIRHAVAGVLHISLLKDLTGPYHWGLAIAVGMTGFASNLAIALVGALLVWWGAKALRGPQR